MDRSGCRRHSDIDFMNEERDGIMSDDILSAGKRILAVDDEADILELLEELLPQCQIKTASTFEEAKELLESYCFDMAILDIMGVEGYRLLEIARQKGIIAVMLTAHALSPENALASFKKGAASYIPKDRIADISTYLADILKAGEKGERPWWRWYDRLGSFFERHFGADWQDKDQELWNKFKHYN